MQASLWVLLVVCYTPLMAKASSKPTGYVLSATFQKAFIVLALVSAVVPLFTSVYYMVQQYPTNQNMSGLLPMFIFGAVVPLVLFLIPLLLGIRRKMSLLSRVFEASLLALLGALAFMTLTSLVFFVQHLLAIALDSTSDFMLSAYGPTVVGALVYIALTAYYVRRRK